MFSKTQILASLSANLCTKVAANKWTDGEFTFRIGRSGEGFKLHATRIGAWPGMNVAMREALRPIFLSAA